MTIVLGFLIEFITVISSYLINANISLDKILSLSESGYKLDYKSYEEYLNNFKLNYNKYNILKIILLLIPGINILNSFNNRKKILNEDNQIIRDNKVLMSDKEINEYCKLKNRYQKMFYTLFMYIEDTNEKDLCFDGLQPVIIDNCLIKLNEKLLPLSYNLDEVLKLNNLTNYSCRLGIVDGINTAIIGIPNSNYKLARIQYDFDEELVTHDFLEMSLEDAKEKKFVVYLFDNNEDIKNKVDKGIEEIKINRYSKNDDKQNLCNLDYSNNFELKRIRKR